MIRDFIDEYGGVLAIAAIVGLIVSGIWVAAKRPPREVRDRYTFVRWESRSECLRSNVRGECTKSRDWTEPVTVYVVVSTDGATCEIGALYYFTLKRGELLKCWQLFGWSGGVNDTQLTKLYEGW